MNNPDRPWTPEELSLLAAGLSNAEVSKRTGRSQAAVRGKRQRLAAHAAEKAGPTIALPPCPNIIQPAMTFGPIDAIGDTCGCPVGEPGPAGPPGEPNLWIGPEPTQKPLGHVWLSAGGPVQWDGSAWVPFPAKDPYEQDKANARESFWKQEHDALKRKYDKALKEQAAVERLVSVARELAPKSYSALPPVVKVSEGKGKPQSALLFLSDTHVGQVVDPSQTLGFGGYDFEVFLARLKFYEEAVTSIMRDHTTTPLDELVIAMGGDMLHGALNHSAEAAQQHTLFAQWYGAGHAFAQFIRNLAPLVPRVRIVCTVGNHTRWGHQHKMPTDNRYSNLDSFVFAYTEALTRDLPNVSWKIDTQPAALFDVQGFLFHLSHGDNLRGGDRALGIPNHAVGRMVSATSQLYGKNVMPSPNYYLVGHLHREIVIPHARGSVVVNGGFPGIDGFGLNNSFSPVDPKQVFFLVHPRYGKTATYDIELKFAKVSAARPYNIPGSYV